MKRIITFSFAILIALTVSAQKTATKFLGIPVDGTKSAMIQKLKAKGFTYYAKDEMMAGEFNGRKVNLKIVTNNNKVYRIMVLDAVGSDEWEIKNRFNTLCRQFEKNGKYMPQNFMGEYNIGEDVNIAYEMLLNNKRFEAAYFQLAEADQDTIGLSNWWKNRFSDNNVLEKMEKMSEEEIKELNTQLTIEYLTEKIAHRSVWFMITQDYGKYYIAIFYDNELNHADGEDL